MANKDPEFSRLDRVASTVMRVLGEPVNELARAQNIGLATITHVDISPDMKHAGIYLSVYTDSDVQKAFLRSMNADAFKFQKTLATQLRTRRTPRLTFHLDNGLERDDRISRLLADKPASDREG